MGMFDAFLGQDTGYTKAQSTGLRRSAEIKRRRKEDERAFERQKMKFEAGEARAERATMEAGETRRVGMREGGETARRRMADVGQMARRKLIGRQQREAATTAAVRAADVKSMEYAREKTLGEIKHPRDVELAKIRGRGALESLFEESPGGVAREGLPGNQKEYSFSQFTGLNREEQIKYMTQMKGKDPKKYLDFARQYKLLSAPEEEVTDMGSTGRSVYQSDSGTYRNY